MNSDEATKRFSNKSRRFDGSLIRDPGSRIIFFNSQANTRAFGTIERSDVLPIRDDKIASHQNKLTTVQH